MILTAWQKIVEREGWRHVASFEHNGAMVCVIDDTDNVEVWASVPDAITPQEAADAWQLQAMGSVGFPLSPGDIQESKRRDSLDQDMPHLIWEGTGEDLSHLVRPEVTAEAQATILSAFFMKRKHHS